MRVIVAAFKFLGKIFNICSKKVGTPFDRCIRVFDSAVTDCYANLGPMFDWICSIAYVAQYVCYLVKPLDLICVLLDSINNSVIGIIVRSMNRYLELSRSELYSFSVLAEIKRFIKHIKATFYVRIRFSHSFAFETTSSKSLHEVTEGIVTEIKERTAKLNRAFGIITSLTSLFVFVVVLKYKKPNTQTTIIINAINNISPFAGQFNIDINF